MHLNLIHKQDFIIVIFFRHYNIVLCNVKINLIKSKH